MTYRPLILALIVTLAACAPPAEPTATATRVAPTRTATAPPTATPTATQTPRLTATALPPTPSPPPSASPVPTVAPSPTPDCEVCQNRAHWVRRGDTLWGLAVAAYGDGTLWPEIVRANPKITQPPLILEGWIIWIPRLR